MKRKSIKAILLFSLSLLCAASYAQSIFIETESFQNKGEIVDQQFMDLMAHGLGTSVSDAQRRARRLPSGLFGTDEPGHTLPTAGPLRGVHLAGTRLLLGQAQSSTRPGRIQPHGNLQETGRRD